MRLVGKREQKNIELQIESLQKKVSELDSQLFKAQADATKALAAADQALADAQAQLSQKNQELASKIAELAAALATTAKTQQDSEAALKAVRAEAAALSQTGSKAQDTAKTLLDAANKSAADAQVQQAATVKELEAKIKDLGAKAAELATAQTATNAAKAEATKANQDGEAAANAAKAAATIAKQESEAANKSAADAKAQQAAAAKEIEAKSKKLIALKTERDKQAKLALRTVAKYQDSAQENELLLLQLMQAQEELVEYCEQKGEFEKLYLAYKARWDRLEKRLPNYLDFGVIDIADVDGVSDVPAITWQVKDFAQAGMALSEFSFVTVLQDGHPGMGLVKDGQPHAFVPKLLGGNKDQLATFLALGTTDFKQLTAAVSILEQLEAGQWKGFEFPAQFDLSFWRPSIKALTDQIKLLPVLLRYDEVRLKRELINPDYEHLWLEFRGISLGTAQWKKFEIRLGAALVQADGFSQYPKFEIPLIDGKTKPFESWYAESQDDSGAKLELRFALDKKVFDVSVWAKLADADKAFVLRLIYAMPGALRRLDHQKTAIHRPWATWIDFAAGAVKVLEANKAAAKVAAQPALEVPMLANTAKLQPSVATPALAAPASAAPPAPPLAQLTPTGPKAGNVISIAAKPVSKPKPVPKQALAAKPITTAKLKPAAKTAERAKA